MRKYSSQATEGWPNTKGQTKGITINFDSFPDYDVEPLVLPKANGSQPQESRCLFAVP